MLIVTIFVCSLVITSYGRVLKTGLNPRIVNGEKAKVGEIPYQVSIRSISLNTHFCGGSIYNENYIITAAHCVLGENVEDLQVIVGTVDLEDLKSAHLLSKIIIHDGYKPGGSEVDDIALIKVASPLKISKTVSPVTMPKPNSKVGVDKKAVVSGWGKSSLHGILSRYLQKVTILTADQDYCIKAYSNEPFKYTIYETQICAHDPVTEHGSCQGDSGGPLTVDGVLVGIVSWAVDCALVKYPTVFTRVSKYIDWIHKHAI